MRNCKGESWSGELQICELFVSSVHVACKWCVVYSVGDMGGKKYRQYEDITAGSQLYRHLVLKCQLKLGQSHVPTHLDFWTQVPALVRDWYSSRTCA